MSMTSQSEIPPSEFCTISGDWDKWGLPNLAQTFLIKCYWMLQNARVQSFKFCKRLHTHVLAWPISQLCNLSIKLNSFPRSDKIAKVKPLFKKGFKIDPQNYCPIPLLPLLSKIIERIVHDQTEGLLSKNTLLYRF